MSQIPSESKNFFQAFLYVIISSVVGFILMI